MELPPSGSFLFAGENFISKSGNKIFSFAGKKNIYFFRSSHQGFLVLLIRKSCYLRISSPTAGRDPVASSHFLLGSPHPQQSITQHHPPRQEPAAKVCSRHFSRAKRKGISKRAITNFQKSPKRNLHRRVQNPAAKK